MHPLVPKQLPVNLTIGILNLYNILWYTIKCCTLHLAFILDIIIIGLLKAFARRRRPPTKKPDFFKSIGPDQYSFPSGHASRTILIAFIFSQINPIFDIGYLNFVASILLWVWSFLVCFSRLLNGRHYLFDVLIGALLGFFEGFVVSYLWMSSERAENILSFFSDEAPDIWFVMSKSICHVHPFCRNCKTKTCGEIELFVIVLFWNIVHKLVNCWNCFKKNVWTKNSKLHLNLPTH